MRSLAPKKKQRNIKSGGMQYQKKSMLLNSLTHGMLLISHQDARLLATDGSSLTNTMRMERLNDQKLGWLYVATIKLKGRILMKPLLLWLSYLQLDLYLKSHQQRVDSFIKWMYITRFFTGILRKKFI